MLFLAGVDASHTFEKDDNGFFTGSALITPRVGSGQLLRLYRDIIASTVCSSPAYAQASPNLEAVVEKDGRQFAAKLTGADVLFYEWESGMVCGKLLGGFTLIHAILEIDWPDFEQIPPLYRGMEIRAYDETSSIATVRAASSEQVRDVLFGVQNSYAAMRSIMTLVE